MLTLGGRGICVDRHLTGVAAGESHRLGGCSMVSLALGWHSPASRPGLSRGDALPGSCRPRKDHRGAEGYHPEMLTCLLLYGYASGVTSSCRIEKATYDVVPFRYLAADQHPDHDTISSFRQQHLEALAALFVQALELCARAGLVKLRNVAIDGTKLNANAGWSHGRSHAKKSAARIRPWIRCGNYSKQSKRRSFTSSAM